MKMPTRVVLSVVAAVLFTTNSVSIASDREAIADTLSGSWTHDSPERDSGVPLASLLLRLYVDGKRISGSYCYIYNYGRKIDCPDKLANNLHGTLSADLSRATVRVRSEFSGVVFKTDLRVNGETLEFTSRSSDGDRVFPHPSAALMRRNDE